MILSIVLIVLIFALLVLNAIMAEWPSLRALYYLNKIPGIKGDPIVGCIRTILAVKEDTILDFFMMLKEKYPRMASFYIAGIPAVFLHEPEDIQAVLGSTNHIHKGREYGFLVPWLQDGLLTSYGQKWQSRRKLLTPTFHYSILDDSVNVMNSNSDKLLKKLKETAGKPVRISDYIIKYTLDVIGESAMGIKLGAQGDSTIPYVRSVKEAGDGVIQRVLAPWQVNDFVYRLFENGRRFYKNVKVLHGYTEKVIKERKRTFKNETKFPSEDDTGKKVHKAFLDCLLETQSVQPDLTDLDIREEVDTFMFEGHDTTSTAVCFGLWLIGSHPEVQEKILKELKEILGDENHEMTKPDTSRMVYLEKVIKETLRLFPSVPYITRQLTQDCVLDDGTVIPNTSNVQIAPYMVHRNEKYFPDPEKFDPERFSEENSVGRHPYAYIPFSAGPRNCIGQKFAMLEMKVTLAKIILRFQVTAVSKKSDFKVIPAFIIRTTKPVLVKFTPRTTELN